MCRGTLRPGAPRPACARSIVQVTTGLDVPAAVARLHEAVDRPGQARVAENIAVKGRIDTVETARLHEAAAEGAAVVIRPGRGAGAQDRQGGGDGQRSKGFGSTHL